MAKSKDLFDDSTMSFGEHLEVLRMHLFKALIGVVLGVIICLLVGKSLVAVVKAPIDSALKSYWDEQLGRDVSGERGQGTGDGGQETGDNPENSAAKLDEDQIIIFFKAKDLQQQLPASEAAGAAQIDPDQTIRLVINSEMFRQFERIVESKRNTVSLTVEEAFMVYLKVSLIGGLILTSPWVIYQFWLFVAAGLYPHERRYVYYYLPISVVLFLTGVLFCFFGVFPLILKFLLGFNAWLGLEPQLRISDWISFAVMLPLMFGLSFQLPLVMLFMERISIFDVGDYREKRRISILVIAVLSMLMTPSDPWSMLAMMIPLMLLYELGILMCLYSPSVKNPFDE